MTRATFALCLFAALAPLSLANSICRAAGKDKDKDEVYRERLEYDPATGQWIELAAPIPGTDGGDLAIARAYLAKAEYKKAREAFALWFKVWPDSPHRPEALFYAAETEVSAVDEDPRGGDLFKAYDWLQELLQGWPGSELADRALRKELIIAEMILFKNRKHKVWKGTLWLSATDEALTMLDKIIDDLARGTPIAEQALRLKADYHYQAGEFEEAEIAYSRLNKDFPRGRYQKIALLRSGESALGRFPGVNFDEADLLEAEVYFKDFSTRYPQDSEPYAVPQKLGRITESRAEKDYTVARYYERVKQYKAAAFYYRQVDKRYPSTTWAIQARERLIALGEMAPPMPAAEPTSEPVTQGEGD
ncbi:MAG TPA: outer membrane protein assembly factor BamD [Phycisphaerae bacterium]|nr:outer membrane protein assembly factor BamD [Phycisphaerae bacterium]